jgi:hypothetical protein
MLEGTGMAEQERQLGSLYQSGQCSCLGSPQVGSLQEDAHCAAGRKVKEMVVVVRMEMAVDSMQRCKCHHKPAQADSDRVATSRHSLPQLPHTSRSFQSSHSPQAVAQAYTRQATEHDRMCLRGSSDNRFLQVVADRVNRIGFTDSLAHSALRG